VSIVTDRTSYDVTNRPSVISLLLLETRVLLEVFKRH